MNVVYEGIKTVLNNFTREIFPLKPTRGTGNPDKPAYIAKVSDRWCLKT